MSTTRKIAPVGAIKGVDAERRRIWGVASQELPQGDRMGDIVSVAGIDTDNFDRNPVLLRDHDKGRVIGRVSRLWTESVNGVSTLMFEAELLPPGTSADADATWALIAAGALRGISIGFFPRGRPEPMTNGYGVVFTSSELLEISVVSVPACPTCLLQSRSACACRGHADPDDLIVVSDEVDRGDERSWPVGWDDYKEDARFAYRLARARRDALPESQSATWPGAVAHARQDLVDFLASIGAEAAQTKYDALRQCIDTLTSWLEGLTTGRSFGRLDSVLVEDSLGDALDVNTRELPGVIADAMRDICGPIIVRETARVIAAARGRID